MKAYKLAGIASVILITACATTHRITQEHQSNRVINPKLNHLDTNKEPITPPSRSASTLTSWQLSGAMAAKSHKKGWAAALNWQQKGQNQYQIRLSGPLGGGTVLIQKQGSLITYRDGPKKISSTNADELLQTQTGIRLPVKDLFYWIRALPAPESKALIQRDQEHRVMSLSQAGYTIQYLEYTAVKGINLPTRIRLNGHGVMIKLVIKQWGIQ